MNNFNVGKIQKSLFEIISNSFRKLKNCKNYKDPELTWNYIKESGVGYFIDLKLI